MDVKEFVERYIDSELRYDLPGALRLAKYSPSHYLKCASRVVGRLARTIGRMSFAFVHHEDTTLYEWLREVSKRGYDVEDALERLRRSYREVYVQPGRRIPHEMRNRK